MIGHGAGPGISAGGFADLCVVKYDTNGAPVWLNRFGSLNGDCGLSFAADAGGESRTV